MSLYFMIISFVLGSVFGSFYNVCIYRIPENLSVCNPPSHCYNCNTRLKPIDLVPILSWLFIGGKCRYCKNSISPRYALIEFLTGVLFTLVYLKFGYRVITVYYMIFISLLIIITFIDIDHYIIPDKLILIGVIVSLVANGLGFGIDFFDGLRGALFTGGSMFIVIWIIEFFIKREVMGGGDIKLYTMVGLFLGSKLSLLTILFSIYIGAFYGIFIILYNKIRNKNYNSMIPFGPFISIASIVLLFYGNQIIKFYINIFL